MESWHLEGKILYKNDVEFFKVGDWYFAARLGEKFADLGPWAVWCCKKPLTRNNMIYEPEEMDIYFELGSSKEETIKKLKQEVGINDI